MATAQEFSGSFGWEFANAESADIIDQATAYMAGTVRNHPFVDGNKPTGIAGTARLTTSWSDQQRYGSDILLLRRVPYNCNSARDERIS